MRVALLVLGGLLGCATAVASPRAVPSGDLVTGLWDLTLRGEWTGSDTAGVRGVLALIPQPPNRPRLPWMNLPEPSHIGVYRADLESLGVGTYLQDAIPHAGARLLLRDSVEIVLNPAPDHGAVVLRGHAQADSITGTWRVTSYGIGKSGRFTLRRTAP